jgi:predicted small integral membrane protein
MSLKFSYCSQSFLIENGEIIVKRVSVSKMSLYITVKLICMWWYFLMMIAITEWFVNNHSQTTLPNGTGHEC